MRVARNITTYSTHTRWVNTHYHHLCQTTWTGLWDENINIPYNKRCLKQNTTSPLPSGKCAKSIYWRFHQPSTWTTSRGILNSSSQQTNWKFSTSGQQGTNLIYSLLEPLLSVILNHLVWPSIALLIALYRCLFKFLLVYRQRRNQNLCRLSHLSNSITFFCWFSRIWANFRSED